MGPQGRHERDTRQTANLPGVRHQLKRGGCQAASWQLPKAQAGEGVGAGGWSQTYLGGRAREGLLRLDGFESEDS